MFYLKIMHQLYNVQCLNSQQLFYCIISLKKATTKTNSWQWTLSWTVLNFLHDGY